MLMIQRSKGAEMLWAAVTQVAFNMGNALGAFLGRYTHRSWLWVYLLRAGRCSGPHGEWTRRSPESQG